MKIYSDSSFLVSLIYPGEPQHQKARAFFSSNQNEDWITSEWSQFETINGLRQLCKKHNGPQPAVAEGLRRQFKHWHEKGAFRLEGTDLNEAASEGQERRGAHRKPRSCGCGARTFCTSPFWSRSTRICLLPATKSSMTLR